MPGILDNLNDEQREAVEATEGFVRVIAGAGTGKTRALAHRFAYLVEAMGVLPSHILCVTFTNKSAAEMRQRIHRLVGDNDTAYVNTFHGFCVSVLQEDGHVVQYPKSFLVLDNSDIDAMLKGIYEERGLSLRDMTFAKARDMFEMRKTVSETGYYKDLVSLSAAELKAKYDAAEAPSDILFYGYLWQEKKCFGLDYNDLIVLTLHIFRQSEEARKKWQRRLEYIMIDEFQDIDPLQYKLMEVLCDYHKNLFVVGDPDQTIYTWRGADVRFLLDFDSKFAPCQTVKMLKNYRSTPEILASVNSLIAKNGERIPKELDAVRGGSGERPIYYLGTDSADEAKWIADNIKAMAGRGTPLDAITILYRAHYVTRAIEDALRRAEIPYVIYSGVQFFDRAEIKDALSYMRLVAFRDDLSFLRVANVPKRNLGERRMAFLKNYAEQNGCLLYEALERNVDGELFRSTKAGELLSLVRRTAETFQSRNVTETLQFMMEESGYERMLRTEGSQQRLDNLAELRQSIYDYEENCGEECTLEHYLSHVALFTSQDAAQGPKDSVKLMTVHAAKGLEFKNVFIAGMNEGIFPSKKTETKKGMEEERRLAFVAMTRAEDRLFVSSSMGRGFDGSFRYPSRFVFDIDEGTMEFVKPMDEAVKAAVEEKCKTDSGKWKDGDSGAARKAQFKAGDAVVHPILGKGIVLGVDEELEAYEVKFERLATPRSVAFRTALRGA